MGAGECVPVPGGADQVFPFVPHSEYRYLTDRAVPGGVVVFDPQDAGCERGGGGGGGSAGGSGDASMRVGSTRAKWGGGGGGWVEFEAHPGEAERLWERPAEPRGLPLPELAGWLAARRGRPIVMLGSAVPGIVGDVGLSLAARDRLLAVRRAKDVVEMERMGEAVRATAAGFARAVSCIKPGVSERHVAIELESGFRHAGADGAGYHTIVAGGANSAVLHCAPSERVFGRDDFVLIDAGAQLDGYTADVTRTYPADGSLRGFRRDLYRAVLRAQEWAVSACVPGAEFRELHMQCAVLLAEGLVSLGVLKGDPQLLVDRDAHAMFFPHGLGHLVGLGVRDASGYLPGRARSERFGLSNLRMDLPLDEGYVVTIEPGLYFADGILRDARRRECYADCVDWGLVDRLLDEGVGGVRIEDDVHVTRAGPMNLTAGIPKAE